MDLGLEGTYRRHPDGRNQLARIRASLYTDIKSYRSEPTGALSPTCSAVKNRENPLVNHVPHWVIGAVCASLVLVAFVGGQTVLSSRAVDVSDQLTQIQGKLMLSPISLPKLETGPTIVERLRDFLDEDQARGQVEIAETPTHAIVRLRGDGLFPSGLATVNRGFLATLERVVATLDGIRGPILVRGHTDNRPINTIKFPSNWHLSKARAEAVAQLLRAGLADPARVSIQPRGAKEPIVSNDTLQNRARNRRVDILVAKRANRTRG
ncbi:MAG: type VI secretion system protein TssL, long form [Pseudomonadota bacterium]